MFLLYFTGLHRSFLQRGFLAPPGLELELESAKGPSSHTWLSLGAGTCALWSWQVSVFGKEHWFFVGCFHSSKKIFFFLCECPLLAPLMMVVPLSVFHMTPSSLHVLAQPNFCKTSVLSLCRSKFSPHVTEPSVLPCQSFIAPLMIFLA